MQLEALVPILQVAIGPVILISGVGLLLLSMTNRFGRIIDRARHLSGELRAHADDEASVLAQLEILSRRARIVRAAIALAGVSVLCAAVLVIVLFLAAFLHLGLGGAVAGLFIACLLCLIASLLLFIADVNVSLAAFQLEIAAAGGERRDRER